MDCKITIESFKVEIKVFLRGLRLEILRAELKAPELTIFCF